MQNHLQIVDEWDKFYAANRNSNLSRVDVLLKELAHQIEPTLGVWCELVWKRMQRVTCRNCSFAGVGSFSCQDNAELVDLGPKGVCIAIRPPPPTSPTDGFMFPVQERAGPDNGLTIMLDPGYEHVLDGKGY